MPDKPVILLCFANNPDQDHLQLLKDEKRSINQLFSSLEGNKLHFVNIAMFPDIWNVWHILIGNKCIESRDILDAIAKYGHKIYGHSFDHTKHYTVMSEEEIIEEDEDLDSIIEEKIEEINRFDNLLARAFLATISFVFFFLRSYHDWTSG